ncbi:MAG: 3-keto-5-aminohexanoate cleavage protein [Deltaproteobacteria bacterium]|nr:3-keto-5-aminohexanoate cleavage protein [Candidatus Zymogenaceae bacterium]
MDPLIIVATPNTCWLKPDVPFPKTPEEIAAEAVLCCERGAAVLHTHAEGQWVEVIRAVRAGSDIIVQCGMSSLEIEQRMDVFKEKADMMSIILSHHDEAFVELDCMKLHSKEELQEYARLCNEYGVKPEFEIWHSGSIWNLNYLIGKKLLTPPYITTLFFGWPGGTWSPPTIEEYLYRRRLMPPGCAVTVSIMHADQIKILVAAILEGDHVRVGTEDYAFLKSGRQAATYELVQEIASISRSLGRPVATVAEARRMLGLDRSR